MLWKSSASHFSHADAVSSRGYPGYPQCPQCGEEPLAWGASRTLGVVRGWVLLEGDPPPEQDQDTLVVLHFQSCSARPGINLVTFIQPCTHLQNIPILLDECKNHCPVMADRGFQYVLTPQKKNRTWKTTRTSGTWEYDMSPTLSYGAVSFLHPNFCLWFLVIVHRELKSGKTSCPRVWVLHAMKGCPFRQHSENRGR